MEFQLKVIVMVLLKNKRHTYLLCAVVLHRTAPILLFSCPPISAPGPSLLSSDPGVSDSCVLAPELALYVHKTHSTQLGPVPLSLLTGCDRQWEGGYQKKALFVEKGHTFYLGTLHDRAIVSHSNTVPYHKKIAWTGRGVNLPEVKWLKFLRMCSWSRAVSARVETLGLLPSRPSREHAILHLQKWLNTFTYLFSLGQGHFRSNSALDSLWKG